MLEEENQRAELRTAVQGKDEGGSLQRKSR